MLPVSSFWQIQRPISPWPPLVSMMRMVSPPIRVMGPGTELRSHSMYFQPTQLMPPLVPRFHSLSRVSSPARPTFWLWVVKFRVLMVPEPSRTRMRTHRLVVFSGA